ncbi:hypothetical protein, partial [Cellulomonas algicola]|uniref:hypothetical protein n=1 Tax=Cellulomonas algicola TaxID=2071633 RepID=UPI00190F781D
MTATASARPDRRDRRPALSSARLAARQLRTDPTTAVLVVLATFVAACVLAAWPRTVDRVVGTDQADGVGRLVATRVDPTRASSWLVDTGGGSADALDDLAAQRDTLTATVASAGPALRPLLGEARVVLSTDRWVADRGPRDVGIAELTVGVRVDGRLPDLVTVADGRLPAPADVAPLAPGAPPRTGTGPDAPLEVALSVASAARIGWQVGELRTLQGGTGVTAVLVGTFEAADPDDPTWAHLDSTFAPQVVEDPDAGTLVTVFPYADPGALPVLAVSGPLASTTWFPLDTGPVATTDRAALLTDLRAFRTATATDTELDAALQALEPRQRLVVTVLGVLAAGPAGVALGVLWLAVALGVERRRGALVLLRARGASTVLVGGLGAGQGLVLGVPAAVAGVLAAVALTPGPTTPTDLAVPLATGLAPAVLLGVAGARVRATRAALSGARPVAAGA